MMQIVTVAKSGWNHVLVTSLLPVTRSPFYFNNTTRQCKDNIMRQGRQDPNTWNTMFWAVVRVTMISHNPMWLALITWCRDKKVNAGTAPNGAHKRPCPNIRFS